MPKALSIVFLAALGVFIIDQNIKSIFLEGYRWFGDYFSLILTFNKGVAFSMFAFLEENLKYIQVVLLLSLVLYALFHKSLLIKYALPFGIVLGAGGSNLYDRFLYGGVVDYFYWHRWFEFAVFNFADVMINVAVALVIFIAIKEKNRA
jgi:signal peptidase II